MSGDPDYTNWFLIPNGDYQPFGVNTDIAGRSQPWDVGCLVNHLIDGKAAMKEISDSFNQAIIEAEEDAEIKDKVEFGKWRGHVYIAGLRLNPNRVIDNSNIIIWSLIKRMMEVGIKVRILLWMPLSPVSGYLAHMADHFYLASLVKAYNNQLKDQLKDNNELNTDIGVVYLDFRAQEAHSSHHQKIIVVRGYKTSVAFCGGVDLTYTRRNSLQFEGDVQSGSGIPQRRIESEELGVEVPVPEEKQGSDLPVEVYGNTHQIWHDQHLKLNGPIIATLEKIFIQRWNDYGAGLILPEEFETLHTSNRYVISSSPNALSEDFISSTLKLHYIKPLEETVTPSHPITDNPGSSFVQVWQTIPMRKYRFDYGKKIGVEQTYHLGEFTIMSGIEKAIRHAQDLIIIFDQYYWLLPHAASLVNRLNDKEDLRIIIILPPFSDLGNTMGGIRQHKLRKEAFKLFNLFTDQNYLDTKIAIFNLWCYNKERGIYCHSKVQAFDQELLVCGSANINWRGFTNDSELCCAVLDKEVVRGFYRNIWQYLFGEILPESYICFEEIDWGIRFFNEFVYKANFNYSKSNGNLIIDSWREEDAHLPPSPTEGIKKDYSPWIISAFDIIDPIAINYERYSAEDYSKMYDKEKFKNTEKYYFLEDLTSIVNRIEGKSKIKFRKKF